MIVIRIQYTLCNVVTNNSPFVNTLTGHYCFKMLILRGISPFELRSDENCSQVSVSEQLFEMKLGNACPVRAGKGLVDILIF